MSKPNYRKQAAGLAALGRGPDTTLVHMSPGEVASLQKIANSAGGNLTRNPQTGLPEAGFLNSILPMIAGGIAGVLSGGTLIPVLAGAATGALTGDKDQSLLMRAGLGALGGFGGAGIGQSLAGVGSAAGKAAGEATTQEALKNATGETIKELGSEALKSEAAGTSLAQGVQALGTQGGRQAFMAGIPGGKLGLAAAGAPMISEAFKQPTLEAEKTADPMYYTGVTYDPYSQTYSGGEFTTEYPGMAEGGEVPPPDPMAQTRAYYQGLLTPQGSTPPSSQALLDYMNRINTNVVQTPVPPRQTPPPAATSTAAATMPMTTAPAPLTYSKKVKKKTVQVPLPGYSYDPATGTYTQTSGPTGAGAVPSLPDGTPLSSFPEFKNFFAASMFAAGGPVMPQTLGGASQQSLGGAQSPFSNVLQQFNAAQAQRGPYQPSAMMPQMAGGPLQQQMAGGPLQQQMAGGPLQQQMAGGPLQQQMAGGPLQQQMLGGPLQQQMLGGPLQQQMAGGPLQQQMLGGMTSQSMPRQSDSRSQMAGGPLQQQMAGGMFQQPSSGMLQQPSMMQSFMSPQQLGAAFSAPALRFAAGGPTYAAGGKLLRGPGDGMSDSIPAVINGTQRAALGDGEFVMPADVVAHLGNGSTTAGADRLYAMMDRVRKARTGTTKQPPAVNMGRLMPA